MITSPNFGNGRMDALQAFPMGLPSTMNTLSLRWLPVPIAGETIAVTRTNATFAHDISEKTMTVVIGTQSFKGVAGSDLTYVITGGATKSEWSSYAATAVTMKDVMDLLNDINVHCEVLNAPYSMSVNAIDIFEADVAATNIPQGLISAPLKTSPLADAKFTSYMRVGLPEVFDGAALNLLDIAGTSAGVTNGVLSVYTDNYSEYGVTTDIYETETLVVAQTSYLGYDRTNANTVRGSLIVKVVSDDLSALNLKCKVTRASLGA